MTGKSRSLPKKKLPSYLLHKPTGQARCRINGKDHYLGAYGTDESRVRYGKLLADMAGGIPVDPIAAKPDADDLGPSVSELILVFKEHAKVHYAKGNKRTAEYDCCMSAVRVLRELYGLTPAKAFGPLALKAVRQAMVDKGWCRSYINKSVGRIRRVFRHAVENELIEPSVLQRLEAVSPLLAGRTTAKDYDRRRPVPQAAIDKVKASVPERTADLIELQLLTGARGGELLSLTSEMIDRSQGIWIARLTDHKTAHRGKERVLVFGPKAQLILRKYITLEPTRKLFNITRNSYGNAVKLACEKLKIPVWTPHWLRHNAGTRLREEYGLDVAQVMLGHSTADVTQVYAALNLSKAIEVAKDAG